MIALLDFEKAFDTVNWSFVQNTLKAFNFGQNFAKWIKILYTDISSCCMNNGHASEFFNLSRGIRQGCPISALLFIMVVEILAINIRSDENIGGIQIADQLFKICQLADDTTLFLNDAQSLKNALELLDKFHVCTGLKLNKAKTQIFYLGNTNHRPNDNINGITVVGDKFKALGIYFNRNRNAMVIDNLEQRYNRFQNILNIWSQRDLSLKGKIVILKSLALPQLLYTTSVIYTPSVFIEKVDSAMLKFV